MDRHSYILAGSMLFVLIAITYAVFVPVETEPGVSDVSNVEEDILNPQEQYRAEAIVFAGDGGSIAFAFRVPEGRELVWFFIQHRDPAFGGTPDHQVIRVRTAGQKDYQVVPIGSDLEEWVLDLLKNCTIARARENAVFRTPTQGQIEWLLWQIMNRQEPWRKFPDTPDS